MIVNLLFSYSSLTREGLKVGKLELDTYVGKRELKVTIYVGCEQTREKNNLVCIRFEDCMEPRKKIVCNRENLLIPSGSMLAVYSGTVKQALVG